MIVKIMKSMTRGMMMPMDNNPQYVVKDNVHGIPEGWYWYDETYNIYGPYKTKDIAEADLKQFIEEVLERKD